MEVDSLSSSPSNPSSLFSSTAPAASTSSNPVSVQATLPLSSSQHSLELEPRLDQLDEKGVAALFASLGFPYYDGQLREHGITGEILVHLDHEALRDVGIHSVGQRLAILRAVWERKVAQNIPVEDSGWRPPDEVDGFEGAEGGMPSRQLLALLEQRDERIVGLEVEVMKLQESLNTLRDDTLRLSQGSPALKQGRQASIRSPTSAAFPHPLSNASTLPIPSNLSRSRSPSHPAPPPHLALPSSVNPSSSSLNLAAAGLPDSPRSPLDSPRGNSAFQPSPAAGTGEQMLGDSMFSSAAPGAVAPTTPTHAPADGGLLSVSGSTSRPPTSRERSADGKDGSSSGGDPNNPYRSFRVTLEDPCYKVLPAALKKYKINDDWRQYALFICHGNTERCLAYDEKPLLLFQRLKEGNANPVFMLRHIKDIKSPIAVASAKHAVRKDKRAPNAGQGLDRMPTVGRDGAQLTLIGPLARPTRLHHPPVLLPVGGKDVDEGPPPSPRTDQQPGSCIAIYPYLADREDEFDVEVGDTFVILAKTKGWWVVHRDLPASAGTMSPSERKSAWVPAGCLLETTVPPLSLPGASEFVSSSSSNAASVPIEPQFVVSVSTPGVALMDYDRNGSDELEVRKGQSLRILKRYNHWSYAIKDDGQRGWIPSWFCSRSSSSSTAVAAAAAAGASRGDATPTTPTTAQQQQQAGTSGLSRSATRQGSVPALRTGGAGAAGEGEDAIDGAAAGAGGGIVLS